MNSPSPKRDNELTANSTIAAANAQPGLDAESLVAALAAFFGPSARTNRECARVREQPPEAPESVPSVEDRYKVLIEQIPAVVFMAFLDGGVSEAYISPQVEHVLGFSREEWLDDPIRWFHQIHPEDRYRWSVEAAEILLKGNPLKSVYRVIARDGHIVWFRCEAKMIRRPDGHPWFIHGVGFDITDLKLSEQALQKETAERERLQALEIERQIARTARSESTLAAIVESSEDAIVSKGLDSIITSWNKDAERMFGFTAAEAVGQPITIIIPPDRLSEETHIIDTLKRGERIEHFDTVRVRNDGTPVDVSVSIAPLTDAAGRVVGASKIARDITARRRAEKNLIDAARRQVALFQLADAMHRARSLNDVYNAALSAITGAVQCERASILLTDDSRAMRFVSWRGLSDEYRAAVDGHSAWAADDSDPRPVCVADIAHADASDSIRQAVQTEGIRALAFIPLVWNGKLIGKFMTYFNEPHAFSDDEIELSLTIARQLTFGIERVRNEEALRFSEERFRVLAETLDSQVCERTKQLETQNAEIRAQSDHIRQLSFRLMKLQDDERRRLARELHDSAGQTLAAISINLAQINREVKKHLPDLSEPLEETLGLAQQLTREIRTTSYLLHPPLLDETGLGAALRWYIEGLQQRSGLQVTLSIPEGFDRLPGDMELMIFRLVQECLTNIYRHSGSKTAEIQIAATPETVSIEVADHGRGMSAERVVEVQSRGSGVGIQGMRERVRHFNGQLTVTSGDSGTRILAIIPRPGGASIDTPPENTPADLGHMNSFHAPCSGRL
ncbi:MAG TPA: PAS domain S-box protein [Candidatus Acidoferrales bacterium]|nr:PAS domain S-box protein [Candidatus Acidoferrales bacterium]